MKADAKRRALASPRPKSRRSAGLRTPRLPPATPREKRRSSSQQPRHNNKIVVLAVHVRSLARQTSTPHVACAPPTAHTAHRAYSDIAIVKIKLDSKATASKICVPSHNRWMIHGTNLDLAGSPTPLSIARGILGSLVMLILRPSMASMAGGGGRTLHSRTPLQVYVHVALVNSSESCLVLPFCAAMSRRRSLAPSTV